MRTFSNVNTLQNVQVEVVDSACTQRVAAKVATNSAARQVAYVHGSIAVNTCAASIRVGVEGCTDCHSARIVRRCGHGWNRADARLSCWVKGRTIQVSTKLIRIGTVDDREWHSALKGGHTGDFPSPK